MTAASWLFPRCRCNGRRLGRTTPERADCQSEWESRQSQQLSWITRGPVNWLSPGLDAQETRCLGSMARTTAGPSCPVPSMRPRNILDGNVKLLTAVLARLLAHPHPPATQYSVVLAAGVAGSKLDAAGSAGWRPRDFNQALHGSVDQQALFAPVAAAPACSSAVRWRGVGDRCLLLPCWRYPALA